MESWKHAVFYYVFSGEQDEDWFWLSKKLTHFNHFKYHIYWITRKGHFWVLSQIDNIIPKYQLCLPTTAWPKYDKSCTKTLREKICESTESEHYTWDTATAVWSVIKGIVLELTSLGSSHVQVFVQGFEHIHTFLLPFFETISPVWTHLSPNPKDIPKILKYQVFHIFSIF